MKVNLLIALLLPAVGGAADASNEMIVGDGQIDGRKVEPFELTWQQCAFQDGQWISQGAVTEAYRLEDVLAAAISSLHGA